MVSATKPQEARSAFSQPFCEDRHARRFRRNLRRIEQEFLVRIFEVFQAGIEVVSGRPLLAGHKTLQHGWVQGRGPVTRPCRGVELGGNDRTVRVGQCNLDRGHRLVDAIAA